MGFKATLSGAAAGSLVLTHGQTCSRSAMGRYLTEGFGRIASFTEWNRLAVSDGSSSAGVQNGLTARRGITVLASGFVLKIPGTTETEPLVVGSLALADVTGMGLSLSNLHRGTLQSLASSNRLVTVTNFID